MILFDRDRSSSFEDASLVAAIVVDSAENRPFRVGVGKPCSAALKSVLTQVDHPWYTGPVYTQPYLGGADNSNPGGEGVQF